MRSRRTVPVVLLIVAASCICYVAFGAYVRGTARKPLARAAQLLQQKQPVQARGSLRRLLWFEPDHPAALHLTALRYLQEQNLGAAIACLARIDPGSPVDRDARLDLSTALLADRQFERAATVLSSYLARYPDSLLARRQLSGLLLTERRQREAERVLEDYLDLTAADPLAPSDQLLVLRDLATAEFHPPLPETCLTALAEALERDPDQPAVRVGLAQCHLDLGNVDEAGRQLRDVLAQQPSDPRVLQLHCAILLATGQFDAAESALPGDVETPTGMYQTAALEQDDQFWELRCRIAEARGDYERALNHIDEALSIRSWDSDYESRRARLLQRLGRGDDAREAYARAHELARSELDLWNLSRDVGVRTPTTGECEQVAALYESLEQPRPAAAWRRLAQQMESAEIPTDATP